MARLFDRQHLEHKRRWLQRRNRPGLVLVMGGVVVHLAKDHDIRRRKRLQRRCIDPLGRRRCGSSQRRCHQRRPHQASSS
jgi:hypothetical protein